jgi:hypothetical protein
VGLDEVLAAFFSEFVAVDERGRTLVCMQRLFGLEFVCMAGMQN